MSGVVRLFYSDQDRLALPEGHRFPAGKYIGVWQRLLRAHPTLVEHSPRAAWDEIALAHAPEYVALILYQAGVDALAGDRLGRLALSHEGLRARDARVFALVEALRVPVVVTLGGGYCRDIEASIEAHANVYRGLVASLG